ncbi:hypothetical protein [Mobiluncus mulieris]|uniref:Uncharacterized protein n=1 Tax=Mobiluncus mulieris TaxID=2052 RepID=A0A7Y0UVY4_9ACTO|nr:hypothetical protein [Mobiluncus mulieris]NMX04373.1 hypothetical protein [Mobiluncus mulieris]
MFLIRVLGLNPPGRIRACWGCWVALGVLVVGCVGVLGLKRVTGRIWVK